jgi:hypothetical protein
MAQRSDDSQRDGSSGNRLSGREVIQRVREDFPQLLGRPIEAVLGLERNGDDGWNVMVSVVELERIPRSTDILGTYSVTLDREGELIGWQRRRRYHRNQADED